MFRCQGAFVASSCMGRRPFLNARYPRFELSTLSVKRSFLEALGGSGPERKAMSKLPITHSQRPDGSRAAATYVVSTCSAGPSASCQNLGIFSSSSYTTSGWVIAVGFMKTPSSDLQSQNNREGSDQLTLVRRSEVGFCECAHTQRSDCRLRSLYSFLQLFNLL